MCHGFHACMSMMISSFPYKWGGHVQLSFAIGSQRSNLCDMRRGNRRIQASIPLIHPTLYPKLIWVGLTSKLGWKSQIGLLKVICESATNLHGSCFYVGWWEVCSLSLPCAMGIGVLAWLFIIKIFTLNLSSRTYSINGLTSTLWSTYENRFESNFAPLPHDHKIHGL